MTRKINTTITEIAIHEQGDNPIFGEMTTHVRLNDEGAGLFIELEQKGGNIRIAGQRILLIDEDELDSIYKTAKMLLKQGGK